jgi:hypothetical protein
MLLQKGMLQEFMLQKLLSIFNKAFKDLICFQILLLTLIL